MLFVLRVISFLL